MATDPQVLKDLLREQRTTNSILRAAFRPQLEELQSRVVEDPVMASVLRHLSDGALAAGDLKAKVTGDTSSSERTVNRRLADMQALGLIDQRGAGGRVTYESTGLVSID
jgi:DNA-binding HxlR family transcriptional regulator